MPVTHSPGNPFAFTPVRLKQTEGSLIAVEAPSTAESALQQPTFITRSPILDVSKLRFELRDLRDASERERIVHESRVASLLKLQEEDREKLHRVEADKKFLFELQEKQSKELVDLKQDLLKQSSENQKNKDRNRKALDDIHKEQQLRTEQDRHELKAQLQEIGALEAQLASQQRALNALKADLTSKNEVLAQKDATVVDLKRQIETIQAPAKIDEEQLTFVTKELASTLSQLESLQIHYDARNADLRDFEHMKKELLVSNEEARSLKQQLVLMDDLRTALAKAELEIEQLGQRQGQSSMIAQDSEHNQKATDKAQALLAHAEKQLEDINIQLSLSQKEAIAVKESLDSKQAELESQRRLVMRSQRAKNLVVREVQFLREQLKSYDLEEESTNPDYEPLRAKRIIELERLLEDSRKQFEGIEARVEVIAAGTKRSRPEENDFSDIERGEYLRKIRGLNAELDILRGELALCQKHLVQMETAAPRLEKEKVSRILQHKDNPTTRFQGIRTAQLHALQVENDALLSQLKGQDVPSVPIQTLRNMEVSKQTLSESILQKDKMMQRLKEVFSAKSSEFREAVYSLLGYKLDFLPNGRVRLTSMFNQQLMHAFVFDGEEGSMKLSALDDDDDGNNAKQPSDAVTNIINYWSGERQSVPGMLSALTLEMIEQEAARTK